MTTDEIERVLRAWYLIEMLTPQSIDPDPERDEKSQQFDIKPGDTLPWNDAAARQQTLITVAYPGDDASGQSPEENANGVIDPDASTQESVRARQEPAAYILYLGLIKMADFEQALVSACNVNRTDFDRERGRPGMCAIASIQVDENGRYLPKSLRVSCAAWSLGKIRAGSVLQFVDQVAPRDFDRFIEKFEVPLSPDDPLSVGDITALVGAIQSSCGIGDLRLHRLARGAVYGFGTYENTDLLNSFYTQDITQTINCLHEERLPPITRNLFAADPPRKDLLRTDEHIASILQPARFPSGAWPNTKIRPALMQQAALILARETSAAFPILAVNGPPGTGKSTMLRSFISDQVVERARALCNFEDPSTAWTTQQEGTSPFHRLNEAITGFECLIASSNNAAIENISDELPSPKSVAGYEEILAAANHFANVAKYVASYRSDRRQEGQAWGLIAASLGSKKKITAFVEPFLYGQPDRRNKLPGHWTILEFKRNVPSEGWDTLRQAFLDEYAAFREKLRTASYPSNWSVRSEDDHLGVPGLDLDVLERQQQLFILALRVHRAFLSQTWTKVKDNVHLWTRVARKPDEFSTGCALAVWQSMFLFVPAISTTFASAARMLKTVPAGALGWAVVDEAGQAVPQAALGLFGRCRKALVVGDPLQIEPVVGLSSTVIRLFRDLVNVPAEWTAANDCRTSLQTLADRACPWGTTRIVDGCEQWVGVPLVVHRRCIQPMFRVSNEIYNNDMVYATAERIDEALYPFGHSAWIDERSVVSSRHGVRQQVELAAYIIRETSVYYRTQSQQILRSKHGLLPPNELDRLMAMWARPDIRVITPFKDIEKLLHAEVRTLPGNWNNLIGTVHKSQGKEAGVIICVLGLDEGKRGAAQFTSDKPNFLNVAITRAKHRIYIIGNAALWGSQPYFQALYADLEESSSVLSPGEFRARFTMETASTNAVSIPLPNIAEQPPIVRAL